MKKALKRIFISLILLAGIVFLAFKLSPYPYVWIIRYGFDKEANNVNQALEAYVPAGITSLADIQYDKEDEDAYLDAYFHKDSLLVKKKLPVIVWTHGGGLVSGNKEQVGNYCKILASKGYLVVSIDYTIAPKGKYPLPVRQLNKALLYISNNAKSLNADSSVILLAGDSGGSMLSAAVANIITNRDYARSVKTEPGIKPEQLKGLLLYCGIYDATDFKKEGDFGTFLSTVTWAYFGKKDISDDPFAKTASVINYLGSSFPACFISAGNADPLLSQSELLAQKLSSLQVPVETLFFAKDYQPALPHEYQFNLGTAAGKLALEQSIQFLNRVTSNHVPVKQDY